MKVKGIIRKLKKCSFSTHFVASCIHLQTESLWYLLNMMIICILPYIYVEHTLMCTAAGV